MSKTNKIISGVIILLFIVGGAFYGGMLYGKNQAATAATAARASFTGRAGRTGTGAGFTTGTVLSNDGTSITLQLPASTGGSKIILYSSATQVFKTTAGTAKDLAVGTSVSVTGTTNSDGSVTAQSIQIRPNKPATQNPGQ